MARCRGGFQTRPPRACEGLAADQWGEPYLILIQEDDIILGD